MRCRQFGLVLCVAILSGCNSLSMKSYDSSELGPARDIVETSIEAMGGLDAWRKVDKIDADAVVTLYSPDGDAHVNRQRHSIDINGQRIKAQAETARGVWKASYARGERFSLKNPAALDRVTPDQLRETLGILLYRVTGPFNLLGATERVQMAEEIFLEGKDLVHVRATGGQASAYYFDANTGLLQMLASESGESPAGRTVTLYTYKLLENGLVFPSKIEIFRTGEAALVSRKPVISVEYTDVQVDIPGFFGRIGRGFGKLGDKLSWRR